MRGNAGYGLVGIRASLSTPLYTPGMIGAQHANVYKISKPQNVKLIV